MRGISCSWGHRVLGMVLALVLVLGLCPAVPAQAQPASNDDSIQTQAISAVTLQLKDGDTGAGIANASFDLEKYDDVQGKYIFQNTFTTDSTGTIALPAVAEGSYRFVQTTYPVPYNTSDGSWSFTVDGSGDAIKKTMLDYARYATSMTFLDVTSNLPIANAQFKLERWDGAAWQTFGSDSYTTDYNGKIVCNGLGLGRYRWVQVAQVIHPTGAQYYYETKADEYQEFSIIESNVDILETSTALVDVTLTINWREIGDASAVRPDFLDATLYADGVEGANAKKSDIATDLSQGTAQTVEWKGQNYWRNATQAVQYTVGEQQVHGGGNLFEYTVVPGNTSQFDLTIDNMYPSYKEINVNTFTKDWSTIPQDVRDAMAPNDGSNTISVVAEKDGAPLTDRKVQLKVDPNSGGCNESGLIKENASGEFLGKTITFEQTLPLLLQDKFISTQEITFNDEGVPNMVNITNIYSTNSLTIRNIKDAGTAVPPAAMSSIDYVVVLSDTTTEFETIDETGHTSTFKSGDTISVPFGSWVSIQKIPDGATYTVTQQPAEGYTCTNPTSLQQTGTISVNQGSNAAFNNTFTQATTTFTPGVSKTVSGPEAPSATFDFTLTAVGDAPMPDAGGEACSVTTNTTATANFGTITYEVPGVYNYVIAETEGTEPSYTYDPQQVDLQVTVERTGNTVTATPVYTKDGQTVTPAVFANKYSAITQLDGTITWTGVAAGDPLPAATIELLQNGTKVNESMLAAGVTSFSFGNLLKYDENGTLYTYTVVQQPIGGYTTTAVGTNITNEFKQETTAVSGTLKFDVPAGTVTPSVTVHVQQDGVAIKSVAADAQHSSFSVDELPVWKTDGTRYVYTLAADPVEGYTASVDGDVVTLTKAASPAAKTLNTAPAKTGDMMSLMPMAVLMGALATAWIAMRKRRLQ